ncbi:MAG: hypothetical protein CM15mP98_12180 [Paracoccaceae bacterium]|nr:MAG: hypothetical protein CM15mP98_12180 [Paracoccaceae bacterium]
MAQKILDNQNSYNTDGTTAIDVFKFSVNDVLNSLGKQLKMRVVNQQFLGAPTMAANFP